MTDRNCKTDGPKGERQNMGEAFSNIAAASMDDGSIKPNDAEKVEFYTDNLLKQPRIRIMVSDDEPTGPPLHVQFDGRQIDFQTYRLEFRFLSKTRILIKPASLMR